MSEFDKEAEREKLRERFAEEEKDREHTERMSELLLQGATMTDTHCDTCGDPLFRYDGQTFCPTCQQTANETAQTTGAAAEQSVADERQTIDEQPTADGRTGEGQHIAVTDPREVTDGEETRRSHEQAGRERTPAREQPTRSARATNRTESAGTDSKAAGDTADLTAAESALVRTLREETSAAEDADDLGRRRDHLAAAREAAEALDAVRSARR